MSFERILFIQHGLTNRNGHWLIETQEWHRAVNARNLKWFGVAHVTCDKAIASAYDVRPILPFTPYDRIQTSPSIASLANLIELSDIFKNTAQKYFPSDISATDLLFFPFSTEIEIFSVARWLDAIQPQNRPAVAFNFHRPSRKWKTDFEAPSLSGDFSTWQYSIRAILQRLSADRVKIFATTNLLAYALGKILGMPANFFPGSFPMPDKDLPPYMDKPYDLGIFGGERAEQGEDKWPGIFTALTALRPNVTASLRVLDPNREQAVRSLLDKSINASNLDICTGDLPEVEYFSRMVNNRVLLLPYFPEKYCYMSSGLFIEAASRGIPVVAPEFTSMGRYIQAGEAAGVVYKNGDTALIAEAVHFALNNIEELYQRAGELSDTWKNKHNSKNAIEILLNSFSA